MNGDIPAFFRCRLWWFIPLLVWAGMTALSLHANLDDQRRHGFEVATEGIRHVFRMVVLTRAWNADHQGVYVPVTDTVQPNPYLKHRLRDLMTEQGVRLTMINPAYMTRQLSEMAKAEGEVAFHITSRKPLRPANAPDDWERQALDAFERGLKERIELVGTGGGRLLRYMAPLAVTPACLPCHADQGYKVGDVRGGISVSLPYAPVEASLAPTLHRETVSHLAVFLVVALFAWLLLELLRRRWLELTQHIGDLETARTELQASNRALSRARDDAEAASQAKTAFLTTMSHEVRTPLNAILGMAALLRGSRLDANQQAHVEALHRAGTNLLGLLTEVLDFTRLEVRPPDEMNVVFDPARLLREIALRQRAAASAKGLRLEVADHLGTPLRLVGTPNRIRHILGKLVDNAIKFTDQGRIGLGLEARPSADGRVHLRLAVADTGIGMGPETQARLFHPFEIADATTQRRHAGIGLGLAFSKRLAEGMGGHIEVASEAGVGSTFTLCLDLVRADDASDPDGPGAADADIGRLVALLEQDDIEAIEAYAELSPALRGRMGERYADLERAMANFDFSAAALLLREWQHPAG